MIVKRSAIRMWLLAIAGIPLLVISVDVLTNRRLSNWLREIVFRPEDTQIYEPRDVIYAWGMLLFAAILIIWGLKELFWPTKVIECRTAGLAIRLRGPFRGPDLIGWGNVIDVTGMEMEDEGDILPLLRIELREREGLPPHPWGARWVEPSVLGVLTQDWAVTGDEAARMIGEYAVASAEGERRRRTASIWETPE
jgi:hypothetical protein